MTTTDGITLRQLAGPEDYRACFELQLLTWGADFRETVPPSVLKITQYVGGVAAGAFDGGGRLLAFVYGLTGVRPPGGSRRLPEPAAAGGGGGVAGAGGSPAPLAPPVVHWSHMLAVLPEARDRHLGTRLKLYQRDLLVGVGVEAVEWTFDPLEARNAHLNLNLLGAEAVQYVEEMYYGEMGSQLAEGIGTDRFIVRWHIGAAGAARERALAAGDSQADPGDPADLGDLGAAGARRMAASAARFGVAPILGEREGREMDAKGRLPGVSRVRVEVPPRIQVLKAEQPEVALGYRLATRRAFQAYLGRGYRVAGFFRDAAGRCFYGMEMETMEGEDR